MSKLNPEADAEFRALARQLAVEPKVRRKKKVDETGLEPDADLFATWPEWEDEEEEDVNGAYVMDYSRPGPLLATIDPRDVYDFLLEFADLGSGQVNVRPYRDVAAAAFTRAGATATTIGSTGLVIKAIGANVARSYYDPTSLAYLGYLAEGARTNLLGRSEEISNATWIKTNSSVTADAVVSPDGTLTADKVVEAANNNIHHVQQGAVGVNGTAYTVSAFFKAGERNLVVLDMSDSLTGGAYAYFNLSTGVISQAAVAGGSWTAASATIKSYPNGWYRCTVTGTLGANNSVSALVGLSITSGGGEVPTYVGDGASGLYVWGAQLETGAFASSYIPTTVATVTRNADVLTYPLTGWYNTTNGTFFDRATAVGTLGTQGCFVSVTDGTTNNRITVGRDAADNPVLFVSVASVTQASITSALGGWTSNLAGKISAAYATNDFSTSFNGAPVAVDTSGTIPTVSVLEIGSLAGTGTFGIFSSVGYFRQRKTNAELQALTA